MSIKQPGKDAQAMHAELTGVLRKYSDKMTDQEIVASLAVMVGQALALLDQRTITPAMAVELVQKNIELGNRQMINDLLGTTVGNG